MLLRTYILGAMNSGLNVGIYDGHYYSFDDKGDCIQFDLKPNWQKNNHFPGIVSTKRDVNRSVLTNAMRNEILRELNS